jgi:hypothetical protein
MSMTKNPNRLMYSRANQAFVFTFGDQLLRMGDNPMFYRQKSDAIRAALRQGLLVDKQGHITSVESDEGLDGSGFRNAVDLGVRSVMKVEGKIINTPGRWVAWESTEGKNKPELLVAIEQQINGKWWPTGGSWSVETLVNGSSWSKPLTSDEIAIDYGQKWYGGNAQAAIKAALKLDKGNLGVASALEGMATLRTRVGTRVRFVPNPGSYLLYSNPPEEGEEGTVTTVSFGGAGKRSSLKGPGGGLLYIEWDKHGHMGVSPRDVEVIGKSKQSAGAKGLGEAHQINVFSAKTRGGKYAVEAWRAEPEGSKTYRYETFTSDKSGRRRDSFICTEQGLRDRLARTLRLAKGDGINYQITHDEIGVGGQLGEVSDGRSADMLSREAYEAAKELYTERNNQGMGYSPYRDVVGDDTVAAAIEAAESDDWEVVWVANDPSEITVLKWRDGDMLGIGGDSRGRNPLAVDLSEHPRR